MQYLKYMAFCFGVSLFSWAGVASDEVVSVEQSSILNKIQAQVSPITQEELKILLPSLRKLPLKELNLKFDDTGLEELPNFSSFPNSLEILSIEQRGPLKAGSSVDEDVRHLNALKKIEIKGPLKYFPEFLTALPCAQQSEISLYLDGRFITPLNILKNFAFKKINLYYSHEDRVLRTIAEEIRNNSQWTSFSSDTHYSGLSVASRYTFTCAPGANKYELCLYGQYSYSKYFSSSLYLKSHNIAKRAENIILWSVLILYGFINNLLFH